MDKIISEVGKRLGVVQQRLNKSNSEMAAIMGNNENISNYLKIKKGKVRITEDKLLVLYHDYNVNLDFLLTGNKDRGIILEDEEAVSDDEKFLMGCSMIEIGLENAPSEVKYDRLLKLLEVLTDMVKDMRNK